MQSGARLSLLSPSAAAATATLSYFRRPIVYPSTVTFPLSRIPPSTKFHTGSCPLSKQPRRCNTRATAGAGIFFGYGSDVLRDVEATALVVAGAYGLVSFFNILTEREIIEQNLSRKLVHILSGLLFMVSWPIFSTSTGARYFASLAPLLNCLRLLINGLSLVTDDGLVKSVTREGKREELLKGPLYYVLILIICALVFWRESPIGVVSLTMMCAGDGIADIIGRRFGTLKIPYNQQKSWAGSISMLIFGSLISIGMLYYFSVFGYFHLDWIWTVKRVVLVALVATVVESLPTTETIDDNISVPLVSMVTAFLSFRQ